MQQAADQAVEKLADRRRRESGRGAHRRAEGRHRLPHDDPGAQQDRVKPTRRCRRSACDVERSVPPAGIVGRLRRDAARTVRLRLHPQVLIVIIPTEVPRMDFLNKTFAQLHRPVPLDDRRRADHRRACCWSWWWSAWYTCSASSRGGPDVDLMNGVPVPPAQLPAMEAAFDKAGLRDYEVRGTQIRVPRGQQAAVHGRLGRRQGPAAQLRHRLRRGHQRRQRLREHARRKSSA